MTIAQPGDEFRSRAYSSSEIVRHEGNHGHAGMVTLAWSLWPVFACSYPGPAVKWGATETFGMRWNEIHDPKTDGRDARQLLESGLSRIHKHLAAGGSLGIISAVTSDRVRKDNEDAHREMIKRFRERGYGPIQATGRSAWGPERSIIVTDAREEDMRAIGDAFGQQAAIFVPAGGKKNAKLLWLQAGGENAGKVEDLGPEHFNTPNDNGITVLKGLGYNPRDTRQASRSFTFSDPSSDGVIEALTVPRGGQFHPLEKPYTE